MDPSLIKILCKYFDIYLYKLSVIVRSTGIGYPIKNHRHFEKGLILYGNRQTNSIPFMDGSFLAFIAIILLKEFLKIILLENRHQLGLLILIAITIDSYYLGDHSLCYPAIIGTLVGEIWGCR